MNKLIFGDTEVSKKDFYESKKVVNLGAVSVDKIVVSNKTKGNNETSKVFIGYRSYITDIVTPLYIILPQMSSWINTLKMVEKICHLK